MKELDLTIEISEDGTFRHAGDRARVADYLRFAFAGRACRLRISETMRSRSANAYLWGVVYETIRRARLECGMPPVACEDLHRHFKSQYLPCREVEVFGISHVFLGTTRTDKTSFYDYVECVRTDEDVRQVLAFANMQIEDPDPQYRSYRIAEPT